MLDVRCYMLCVDVDVDVDVCVCMYIYIYIYIHIHIYTHSLLSYDILLYYSTLYYSIFRRYRLLQPAVLLAGPHAPLRRACEALRGQAGGLSAGGLPGLLS